jgi:thiol-disulfide isomerase/thioredoxin
MHKNKFLLRNIPGWAVMLAVFGILYLTGLHTEAIGQVQRLLLATGVMDVNVPEKVEPSAAEIAETTSADPVAISSMAGKGFQMRSLDGKTVKLESLKVKVVFMNIWATWCPPCIAEMPNIQRLYEKVGSDKIAFVMLSVDEGGMEKVQKFIGKKGFTFPVYIPASQLPQEFSTSAIPTTFIISPEGKIVVKQEGMAEYDTPEMQEYLQSLAR